MTVSISRLQNPIMPYAWGSKVWIPEFTNRPLPSDTPVAELWMGAHPKAPSQIEMDGRWVSLDIAIHADPLSFLGESSIWRFGLRLPFLFKILAVETPLSIQAHPDKIRAKKGFTLENQLGVSLDAPQRNYRDDNHKPECICALTPFWALRGFRPLNEIIALLETVWPNTTGSISHTLKNTLKSHGLTTFYQKVMTLPEDLKPVLVSETVERARSRIEKDSAFEWIVTLNSHYPGDIGVLSPVFLNLVRLEPAQALFLDSGTLHAYLFGMGIELMANSDNVLRGGLTPKNVDVDELLKVVRFTHETPEILTAVGAEDGASVYPSFTEDFTLSTLSLSPQQVYQCNRPHGIEIWLLCRGEARITDIRTGTALDLKQGDSVLVPSVSTPYRLEGNGMLYRASVKVH